jgi:actin-like ATPase involved in cell morphogenesis
MSNKEEIDCYSCKGKHRTQDLSNTPVIKHVEDLVKSHVSDLFEYVKKNLDKTASSLEGDIERNIFINN